MRLELSDIREIVGRHYNIPKSIMCGPSRAVKHARPRMIAMALCREYTDASLPKIGRYFGNRDHTTVINAQKRFCELVASSEKVASAVADIRAKLAMIEDAPTIVFAPMEIRV